MFNHIKTFFAGIGKAFVRKHETSKMEVAHKVAEEKRPLTEGGIRNRLRARTFSANRAWRRKHKKELRKRRRLHKLQLKRGR